MRRRLPCSSIPIRATPDETGSMTIGIVGGGQLGRMMALAGYPLGLDFLFLDRSADTPAAQVSPMLVGEFTDRKLLRKLARRSEVITFDWENVSIESLRTLGRSASIAPPLAALAMSQDRIAEKKLFDTLGIPTTRYAAVESQASLVRALRDVGLPGVRVRRSCEISRRPGSPSSDSVARRSFTKNSSRSMTRSRSSARGVAAARSQSIHSTVTCIAKASYGSLEHPGAHLRCNVERPLI